MPITKVFALMMIWRKRKRILQVNLAGKKKGLVAERFCTNKREQADKSSVNMNNQPRSPRSRKNPD